MTSPAGESELMETARWVANHEQPEEAAALLSRATVLKLCQAFDRRAPAPSDAVERCDIEHVARAICVAERMNDDDPYGGWSFWTEAAIAAIRAHNEWLSQQPSLPAPAAEGRRIAELERDLRATEDALIDARAALAAVPPATWDAAAEIIERCAKAAEEETRAICRGDDFVMVGPAGVGRRIAAAIRALKDQP